MPRVGPLERLAVAWLERHAGGYVMSETQRSDLYAACDGDPPGARTSFGNVHAGTTQATVSRSLQAPREARRFVEAGICPEHACRALFAVRLAASELATRAVLVGQGPLTIGLNCDLTTVTVWVVFPSSVPVFGAPLALADDVAARVIESISRDWGVECLRDAERLWCTIPTEYEEPPAEVSARLSLAGESAGPPATDDPVTEPVDEPTDATGDGQLETRLIDLDRHLASLPEVERRARMHELVMWLGLVDPT